MPQRPKWSRIALLALLAVAGSPGAAPGEPPLQAEVEADPRDLGADAGVSLTDAIVAALASQPGRAVEAELEARAAADGTMALVYEVAIVSDDGHLHELLIDAASAAVLGRTTDEDEDDDDELAGFQRALRHAEVELADLVASARSVVNGIAVEAELEYDDGGPEADIVLVNGRYLLEVGVEARAGHVIEVDLEDVAEDDDDGRRVRRRSG